MFLFFFFFGLLFFVLCVHCWQRHNCLLSYPSGSCCSQCLQSTCYDNVRVNCVEISFKKHKYCLSCVYCSVTFCCYHGYAARTAYLKCFCLPVNPSSRLCAFQRLFISIFFSFFFFHFSFCQKTPLRSKCII